MVKVKHIEHVDDYCLEGNAIQAIDTMYEIIDTLKGRHSPHITISTKYDGAPSLVFGTNPENGKFFVGTKSVFNKTIPRVLYSHEDIYANHSDPGLQKKLKLVLDTLKPMYEKRMIPPGVFQGDYMYSADDLVYTNMSDVNISTIEFTPNTITYLVDDSSPHYDNLFTTKLGIAVHTKYDGDTIGNLSATNEKIDFSQFNDAQGVFWISPYLELNDWYISTVEHTLLNYNLAAAEMVENKIRNSSVLPRHSEMLKKFLNYCIKIGENNPSNAMYKVFLNAHKQEELAREWDSLDIMYALMCRYYIDYVKRDILRILESTQTFLTDINGVPTGGEGYVVNYHGVRCKLVNRIEFSRNNFLNKRFTKA